MFQGCVTALITPFDAGGNVDETGLQHLLNYQLACGITGVLAVGTTGESPALSWNEHNYVTDQVARNTRGRGLRIAGTGSNNTREALEASRHAVAAGMDALLLVDPYYNGPSSLEIRRNYLAPVARAFPNVQIIPYVIPGRTGTQLLPEDLALASQQHTNIRSVKEATGDLHNMRRTRKCCGADFAIISGDDALTMEMMSDSTIGASGVISVLSNVVPAAVVEMVTRLLRGDQTGAGELHRALEPLFGLVTVKTEETTPLGPVVCRARNPLPVKTLMAILGMPGGSCRAPMGKMTWLGVQQVLKAARDVFQSNPDILAPVAEHFGVNLAQRLEAPAVLEGLYYQEYVS